MENVETIKIQLVEGKHVRDPDTGRTIGNEPIIVEKKSYWLKRVADGSIKIVEDVATKKSRQGQPE